MTITTLSDGCIRVCLTEDGITACTTVSSHHLVPDKESQLRRSIALTALDAYTK